MRRAVAVADELCFLIVEGIKICAKNGRPVKRAFPTEKGSDLAKIDDRAEVVCVYNAVQIGADLALADIGIVAVLIVFRPLDNSPFIKIAKQSVLKCV